ncbi:PAS domain S-box protein [Achromobacter sp. F4_2707]|uniref:PAS domain-containing protein n=1 Tax=Achromobacter sp. F4_2707 TaxID=3114286 RepID=UPI0039C6CF3B
MTTGNDEFGLAELILEQTSDALIYADLQGVIQRWNQAACSLFGYRSQEALGASLDIIIPEHLRAPHWAGYHAAMKSGSLKLQGHPTVTRAVHKSGDKLYVEMTFALVKSADGAAIGSVAMARDVTERVQKERAARIQQAAEKQGETPSRK